MTGLSNDLDPEARHLPLPLFTWRGTGLAMAAGVTATIALALSPYGSRIPPIVIPTTFIDVRFIFLPLFFAAMHVLAARAPWPYPAITLPALALSVAATAHFQGSALLDFLTALEGTEEGTRVRIGAGLFSGASFLLALTAMLERAKDRVVALARRSGVDEAGVAHLEAAADARTGRTIGFTCAAFVALLLVARIGDSMFGASRIPIAEIVGAAMAVTLAIVLFPGVAGRVAERFGHRG